MTAIDLSRAHADPYVDDRAPLQIDRERVIHAAAFRRLQHKTQVFVAQQGDHFRSRMTHTLEVASLARRIAERVGADPVLAEVVALAHDLGHPPFAHAGERALSDALRAHGLRFEHNAHSLRVVTLLEHPYPAFRGLNLTGAVRTCLATHTTLYDRPDEIAEGPVPPAGQVVARADELTYAAHDLADGLHARLVDATALRELRLWRDAYIGPAEPGHADLLRSVRATIERMQRLLIDALEWRTGGRAAAGEADVRPAGDAAGDGGTTQPGNADSAELVLAPQRAADFAALTGLLKEAVYRSAVVTRMDVKAERIVRALFEAYLEQPRLLPARWAARVAEQGAAQVAADYIAGMTDRFAREEHARLFDPHTFA